MSVERDGWDMICNWFRDVRGIGIQKRHVMGLSVDVVRAFMVLR
jgi:hypothetical protein